MKEPGNAQWKMLHWAKSLDQLKMMAACDCKNKKVNVNSWLSLIDKTYSAYEDGEREGDEEKMYIYLFKYIQFCSYLQKNCDDPKYVLDYLGKTKIAKAMNDLEALDTHLRTRYAEHSVVPAAAEITREIKSDACMQRKNSKNNVNNTKKIKFPEGFIECKQLYNILNNSDLSNILIMDVREEPEFSSKIMTDSVINVPASIISAGLSARLLEDKLPAASKALWMKRANFEYIVLVDYDTNKDNLQPNRPISILKKILTEFDYPIKYKDPPQILEGGMKLWSDTYPSKTNNPCFVTLLSKSSHAQASTVQLEDIEYPDPDVPSKQTKSNQEVVPSEPLTTLQIISTIPRIHENTDQTPSKPFIDRSVKPVTEKTSLDCQKFTNRKSIRSIHGLPTYPEVSLRKDFESDTSGRSLIGSFSTGLSMHMENKENERVMMNKEIGSSMQNGNKNDSEIVNLTKLKFDSNISGSSGLKKSLSSPNIAQADDDMKVLVPKTPPTLDRSKKPSYLTPNNSPRYGLEQQRITAQDELEGAVIGADISRGLTGLKNLGNSCYMNSILQCISNTTELRQELCKFYPSESFRNNAKSKTQGFVLREVERVIRILWHGNIKYFSCLDLKTVVGKFRDAFKGYEQQDSHEFFTILMDWLHEDLNEPSPKSDLLGAAEETGEKAWGEFRKDNNSIVLKLFYGQQKSTVKCDTCGKKSVTFEPFSNLSLLLPNNTHSCTLNECLDLYVKQESISGWNCPDCKTPRNATKKVDITRLPPVLVIHFKRFTSNGWSRKKQTLVNFPLEGLNMRQFALDASEQRNEIYNLYAVSNHFGTMEGGHYTAYCYNAELNRWFKFDDQDVSDISPSDVKTSAAYILFYSALKR